MATKRVTIALSLAEARGLLALASEGASALFTDPDAARGYIGGNSRVQAAERGYEALRKALSEALID